MEKLALPTLKSCRHKYAGANDDNVNDRLSQLPLDIQLLILSYLPLEESASTCVLSHEWKHIWKYLPVLFFQVESSAIERIEEKFQLVSRRSDFVRWVNSIVEAHLGSSIDDFKVIFDLDINNELTIDKWVVFALSKQVKRLELNFTPGSRLFRYIDCYTWPPECRLSSLGYHRNLSSLRSLCLKYVNMNYEDIKGILLSCHDLENLCIISGSLYLKRIEIPHASLQLKHLEVACLPKLLCIDILTPKLVSLTYQGHPIKLNIRDAALLSDVSIGNGRRNGEVVTHAYRSLAKYFPQLTSLSWDLLLNPESGVGHIKWN
ncbi:unnamed protein product [Amaranthus hypochondriacus]